MGSLQAPWTAAGRLEAVVTTAAMNEAELSAWCRSHGVYPQDLAKWRASATTALAAPEELRASPQATRADRKRIKELERELLRKDRALAETAALLVLSKKVQAIFSRGEDEWSASRIANACPKKSVLRMPQAHGCTRLARSSASTFAPCTAGRRKKASQRVIAGLTRCARCPAMP